MTIPTEKEIKYAYDAMPLWYNDDSTCTVEELARQIPDDTDAWLRTHHHMAVRLCLLHHRLNNDFDALASLFPDWRRRKLLHYLWAGTSLCRFLDGPYPELHRCSLDQLAIFAHLGFEFFFNLMSHVGEPCALSTHQLRETIAWLEQQEWCCEKYDERPDADQEVCTIEAKTPANIIAPINSDGQTAEDQ